MSERTITFSTDEVAEIISLIQTYAGDSYNSQSYLMDQWFMDMLEARLNGLDDPEKPTEEDMAAERNCPVIREGTIWKWQGGFDGEYVDTGEEPSMMMKMVSTLMPIQPYSNPFLNMFPKTVTIGDYTKSEWGLAEPKG